MILEVRVNLKASRSLKGEKSRSKLVKIDV